MAFMLVYSGEHYFFDVVVGWFYTVVVVSGFALWRRYRPPPSVPATTLDGQEPAVGEARVPIAS